MTTKMQEMTELAAAQVKHATARVETQLRFARELCEWHPAERKMWLPLIDRAAAEAEQAAAEGGVTATRRAVSRVEGILAPLGKVAKTYTLHCVGHAHIDMNWMWSWPETVGVTVDTFGTVLRLMEEYPEFCFSQSQASVYAILEKHRPDILAQVAKRVKEGRWEVTASHWVECEKNLAGPESLCRHILYTRRYMQKLFGLSPEDVPIDWSPDTFGHPATVPTYLARSGIKYLYLHRPGNLTQPKVGLFWWLGPDGSRVLVKNDFRVGYNGQIGPGMLGELLLAVKETGLRETLCVYGVGDHGGGPTRRDLEQAIEMNAWPIFPNVRFSTAKAFYETVAPLARNIPVIQGELNFECAGCYTTQTLIKKANRYGENRLIDAETAAGLAWAAIDEPYPAETMEEGWRNVLFNHFHDILPGSGVMDTRTYSHGLYQQTVALSAQAETRALRALAARIDTRAAGMPERPKTPSSHLRTSMGAGVGFGTHDGGFSRSDASIGHGNDPFVLFNPTAHDREEVIEATVWDNGPAGTPPLRSRAFSVLLPDGSLVPAQVVGGGGYWGHDHAVLAFPVRVPALGYALYTVVENGPETPAIQPPAVKAWQLGREHHCFYMKEERGPEGLENDLLRVEIDPVTGGIRRLADKTSGLELVTPACPAPPLEFELERPHGMTAWLVEHAGAPAEFPVLRELRRGQKGPYKATLEAVLRIRQSEFTLTYEVRAGDPRLYVGIKGVWFERGTAETGIPVLNFKLPLALKDCRGRYEIPFGAIDRKLNQREEVPSQQWAQVIGKAGNRTAGCLLANDCKYGHSLDGSTLRLTLIRSSYDPDILPEIGQHEMRLAIRPFAGDLSVAEAIKEGVVLNRPIRAVGTGVHVGDLPANGQLVEILPAAVIVSGLKKAEEGNGLVLRLFNPTDRAVAAKLKLNSSLLPKPSKAVESDLMERPMAKSAARLAGNTVSVNVPGRGIVSVRVEFS
jgi:alpha-mannosidase